MGLVTGSKVSFFAFPASKLKFNQQLSKSQLLSTLWYKSPSFDSERDALNAPSTLPLDLKPRAEIYHEVQVENPNQKGAILKAKQLGKYGKSLVKFYKKGVSNVWNNKKEFNRLMKKDFKIINQLNNRGKQTDIRIPNFQKLTQEMSQAIYMNKVENSTLNDNTRGDVVRSDVIEKTIDEGLFNMTRHQYQLIRRTRKDFLKLPSFAVIFAAFFEFTPVVCYAIPEITPLTCILPSLAPRIWSANANKKLRDHRMDKTDENLDDLALRNAYNIPLDEARLLCRALCLTSKYVPSSFYPETVVRGRLQLHYNYLQVDNYYLSGLNGEGSGNIWNLSQQELFRACLERNLILDLKQDMKNFDNIEDEATQAVYEEKYFTELRLKLFHFIVDFEQYNIGYLGMNHLVKDSMDTESLLLWWKQDNIK